MRRYNMFFKFIKNLIKKPAQPELGRWKIEQCTKKLNRKIDLSNEDHCGPCSQYAFHKLKFPEKK
jgi:hypothetical protein